MSKTTDLLDEIKRKHHLQSNYALAKTLVVDEARIHDYYKGKCLPDDYAIVRIALALKLEPLDVLADIRAESEKNPKKKEFWSNFRQRAAMPCVLAAAFLAGSAATRPSADAQTFKTAAGPGDITKNYALLAKRYWKHLTKWLRGLQIRKVEATFA